MINKPSTKQPYSDYIITIESYQLKNIRINPGMGILHALKCSTPYVAAHLRKCFSLLNKMLFQ